MMDLVRKVSKTGDLVSQVFTRMLSKAKGSHFWKALYICET